MTVEVMEPAKRVIPLESDMSAGRNDKKRSIMNPLNPLADFIADETPITGTNLTVGGGVASMAGIHLMESQHRARKYSVTKTALAIGLVGIGILCDGLDGKVARRIRNKMTDEGKIEKSIRFGQMIDPVVDGIKEGFLRIQAIWTSIKLGHPAVAISAGIGLITDSRPRWKKAQTEALGKSVPESYSIIDPKMRLFGTSLGRNINYLATFIGNPIVRTAIHLGTSAANEVVARERERIGADSNVPKTLSETEIENAKYREQKLKILNEVNKKTAVLIGSARGIYFGGQLLKKVLSN